MSEALQNVLPEQDCSGRKSMLFSKSTAVKARPIPYVMDIDALCKSCYQFWTDTDGKEAMQVLVHGFERPTDDMRATAEAGCHCCAIFLANMALNEPHKEILGLGNNNRVFVMIHENMQNLLGLLGDPTCRTKLRFILRLGNAEFRERLVDVEHGPSTGSAASFVQAKEWLRTCQEEHEACRVPDTAYYPSRLLYIDSDNGLVALRSRERIPSDARYAALSHCWGEAIADSLKRDNLPRFQAGMPLSQLARTFREAVTVCQEFGLEHIWIDCFCIIQDDVDDWRRESVKMQQIYGNAYLTIAATDAKNSHEGLFRERNAKVLRPFKFSLSDMVFQEEMENKEALFESMKDVDDSKSNPEALLYLTDIDLAWERFEEAPLNRRSWTLQERILSPRVLHYDKDQIVWECDTLTACERFPGRDGIEGLIPAKKRVRASVDKLHRMQVTDRPLGQELHDSWRPIIKAYTSAGLTKQTDRLIALEGIAQWLAQIYNCSYVAGLFTQNMESQLAWRIGGERQQSGSACRIPNLSTAPSWSWASYLGEIDMLPQWQSVDTEDSIRAIKGKDLCELILCNIINKVDLAASWSPTSPLVAFPLIVRCFLAQVRLVDFAEIKNWPENVHKMCVWRKGELPKSSSNHLPYDEQRPLDDLWPLAYDGGGAGSYNYRMHDGRPTAELVAETLTKKQADSFGVCVDLDYWENYRKHRVLVLMPTYEVTQYEPDDLFEKHDVREIQGLVLESVDKCNGTFRRIGTFVVKWNRMKKFWHAAVGTDVPGLPKYATTIDTWPATDGEVSWRERYPYERREQAPQYQIEIV